MGVFVWGDIFVLGSGEGFIFFLEDETDSDTNLKKKTTKKKTQDGLDPLVVLSLPLYVITSVSINTVLWARQKGYEVNMEIPVGFKLCKLLTSRYF